MSLLWNCQNLSKTFASKPLFKGISFSVREGDRLGLIGPNGSGKSTLLKIMAGIETPDEGIPATRKGCHVVYLPQDSVFDDDATLEDVVLQPLLKKAMDDYERQTHVAIALGRMDFQDPKAKVRTLSGGMKKRLALARALVDEPDLLLLDEPTNHLDVEGILLLEEILKTASFACVIISHDRYVLQNTTTRIAELNPMFPQGLLEIPGDYTEFLTKKNEFLEQQVSREESLANKVRREVEWLRQGVKARTTKSSARIQAAEQLQEDLSQLKALNKKTGTEIDFTGTGRKSKRLISLEGVSKSFAGRTLFRDLDYVLSSGQRVGLLGLNGSRKSTLLKMLLGDIAPDTGVISRVDGLRIVYFDQMREQLSAETTLRKVLEPNGDSVIFQGRSLHVVSYIRRFQFRPEQLDTPVSKLSGGERARLLIARLMLQPADVLLLDEPTNDLDIQSLEALEDSLLEFTGSLVLVTHDRYLLDRVSTTLLAFGDDGKAEAFADFAQWFKSQKKKASESKIVKNTVPKSSHEEPQKKKKPTFSEQREWENMEKNLMETEAYLEKLQTDIQDPKIVRDPLKMKDMTKALAEAEARVRALYERWAVLEEKFKD